MNKGVETNVFVMQPECGELGLFLARAYHADNMEEAHQPTFHLHFIPCHICQQVVALFQNVLRLSDRMQHVIRPRNSRRSIGHDMVLMHPRRPWQAQEKKKKTSSLIPRMHPSILPSSTANLPNRTSRILLHAFGIRRIRSWKVCLRDRCDAFFFSPQFPMVRMYPQRICAYGITACLSEKTLLLQHCTVYRYPPVIATLKVTNVLLVDAR